jgi:rhodanese-related sulfurtransferase
MNKTLKRFLVLLTVLAMVFSMVACSPATEAPTEPETPAETETPVEPEAPSEDVLADAVNAYFAEMPDGIYKIKQDAFLDKVAKGEDMFILDIRQADAYAAGHVKGAVNAPWGPAIAENLKFIPQDKTVYVYCYSGQTAGQAVMTLNAAGINAISVNLGFNYGISRVDGYEAFLEMDANEFGADEYEVALEIQDALTAYYAGLADVKDSTFGNYKISEASLREMMDNMDDSIYILSIRSEADYADGHIVGAEQMSFGAGMQENFADLPMDKKIVVYCYTGQTAGQTTAGLRLLGYDAVSLNGGMGMSINAPLGWANKGFPVHVVEEAATSYFADYESSNIVPSTTVFEAMDDGEDMFILDIRQPDVYAEGHLKGAVNVPWNADLGNVIDYLPMDKPIYVNCYTGQTAGQATSVLRMAGFNVMSIKYGYVLGISKTEGYEGYIETEANEMAMDTMNEIAPAMKTAVVEYFQDMAVSEIKNNIISSTSLNEKLQAADDSIFVLSIRQPDAYAEGHIPTAINIPWAAGMNEQFNTLPRDKTIVVQCYSGQTAGQTVGVLRFLGYDAVSLKSGMGTEVTAPSGWANEGFEVVQ